MLSLSLGLSLTSGNGGGGPALLAQVLALSPLALYDTSVLSSLYEDRSATPATPASPGGVVGTITDLTGNARHAIALSDAARGILLADGDYPRVELDGVDDMYVVSPLVLTQPDTICIAARNDLISPTATEYLLDGVDGTARQAYWGVTTNTTIDVFAGSTVTTTVNKSSSSFAVQLQFDGAATVHRYNGAEETVSSSPGAQGVAGLTIGGRFAGTNAWEGAFSGLAAFNRVLTADEKTTVDLWLASLNGAELS